ncbi:MAG TPA: NUDIX hydrolase [Pseudolabrys sp.]|nr:NUDIX hydrolase [Pseudolabrys sp.]
MSSDQEEEPSIQRYRELLASNPELFGNPDGCPTKLLFNADEIDQAKRDVLVQRQGWGWPVNDLRVGVVAEDPYIGYVIRDAVRFYDGKLGLYNRVVASGGIVVLPILPDGSIALIRIFRHPARRWFLEAPQGLVLPGAEPAEEARREMMEEMGATVDELTPLGVVYTSTALTSENLKMFAARISSFGDPQRSEGIESIQTIAKGDIDRLVLDGTITDGPTMSLILRARIRGLL